MARNDGIDRTFARNQDLPTLDDVAKVQEHNEREKLPATPTRILILPRPTGIFTSKLPPTAMLPCSIR